MPCHKRVFTWLALAVMVALGVLSACGSSTNISANGNSSTSKVLNVVAAENFYGDMVKQLGGSHVAVTSILSDPNVDPHEYESSINTAKAVSKANLVIENGGGYDNWMDKLLSAAPSSNRVVLKGFDIATTRLPDNEHVWYSVDNVQVIAQAIIGQLKKLDAADAAAFDNNFQAFQQSLAQIRQKINEIKSKYNSTPVGLTETIFQYQAVPLGLKVLTPFEFQKAMAEGNDPPANTVVTAENQITGKQVKVLIYNEQAVSPVVTKLQNDAKAQHIPVIPVTETMPPGKQYQTWMLAQLNNLEQGLAGK